MKELSKTELVAIIKEIVGGVVNEQTEAFRKPDGEPDWAKALMSTLVDMKDFQRVKQEEPGIIAAQFIRSVAGAYNSTKSGRPNTPIGYAKAAWGEDTRICKALAATDFASGGALIPPEVSAEIIELLRPASAVRSMSPALVTISRGQMPIPKITGGAAFGWIGENSNLLATELSFGQAMLVSKKGGALIPISNDMLRRGDSRTDGLIRDDMVAAIAQGTDLAYIRGDGLAANPKGLRYQAAAANVIPANATVNLANVTTDLGKMILALANSNVRFLRPGWVMAPRTAVYLMTVRDGNGNFAFRDEMLSGRLWNYPWKWTTQIPINLGGGTDESELYFADFADVVIGDEMQVQIDVSTEAAYHDGSNVVAAFSMDQTVIRAMVETDLTVRHEESVAVLTAVKWSA